MHYSRLNFVAVVLVCLTVGLAEGQSLGRWRMPSTPAQFLAWAMALVITSRWCECLAALRCRSNDLISSILPAANLQAAMGTTDMAASRSPARMASPPRPNRTMPETAWCCPCRVAPTAGHIICFLRRLTRWFRWLPRQIFP